MNLRRTVPQSVFDGRVKHYFGTLVMEELAQLLVDGRQTQNYYHQVSMLAIPYFDQLTTR